MRIDVSKRCCAATTGRLKSTKPCTTCVTRYKCTMAAGTRKKSCAFATCSITPPKPLSMALSLHFHRRRTLNECHRPQTIHRVMHEIKRRKLEVLRVTDLTPRMRRITVSGPELAGFISLGSDDHVKLFFPQNAEEQAALEGLELSAGLKSKSMPAMRDYTPRRYDLHTLELDIDFVLHGDGPASTWAAQATPGQYLHIGGPRGSMVVPDIFDSYLLIGDETAIPAIARRLQELPANRRALVVVDIENAGKSNPLTAPQRLT